MICPIHHKRVQIDQFRASFLQILNHMDIYSNLSLKVKPFNRVHRQGNALSIMFYCLNNKIIKKKSSIQPKI